jgi:hypothetical protein
VRRLFDREPREESQLDDPYLLGVTCRQSVERLVDRQHVGDPRIVGSFGRGLERHEHCRAAALLGPPRARVVDQNSTHQLRGYAEEVRPILPGCALLIHQPQVQLVDECRRL